jgi:hypothetical protein
MIAKHIAVTAARKSSFGRLVRYLTESQGKEVRKGAVRVTNCYNDSAEVAALEVLNTQSMNTRSMADKTYHLIVSFQAGEEPDSATLTAIEDRVCDGLGFSGHQRVSVVHQDTDNLHLHIAINKIHRTRYTIQEPFRAYRTLAKLCEKLEAEYSLQKDNHVPRLTAAENRAADMEHHSGIESLLGWVRRECKEQMLQAQSWEQLHAVLADNGMRVQARGNGLVISANDGTTVKASSVGPELSRPRLEQRFGPFETASTSTIVPKPARRYEKKPVVSRVDTTELFARYKAAQEHTREIGIREREQARARKDRRIDAARRSVDLNRAAFKLTAMPVLAKKLMHKALTRAFHEEMEAIKRRYLREREAIHQQHRLPQWADWLRCEAERGAVWALAALRARNPGFRPTVDAVAGPALSQRLVRPSCHDSITKMGTIIYRVGDSAIRDDGTRLRVSLGADQAALKSALRMAIDRYGERIAVNGSDAFKEKILMAAVAIGLPVRFDDPTLEERRLRLIPEPNAAENARNGSASTTGPQDALVRPASRRNSAAESYITEREEKRAIGCDVPKHARYTPLHTGPFRYAGLRHVDGETLALLKHGDEVLVVEVTDAAALHLKRLPLGTQVRVAGRDLIRTGGRSR